MTWLRSVYDTAWSRAALLWVAAFSSGYLLGRHLHGIGQWIAYVVLAFSYFMLSMVAALIRRGRPGHD